MHGNKFDILFYGFGYTIRCRNVAEEPGWRVGGYYCRTYSLLLNIAFVDSAPATRHISRYSAQSQGYPFYIVVHGTFPLDFGAPGSAKAP